MQVRQKPPAPLGQAWGLAVYPVTFRFPVTPYESFVRGRAIADELSRRTDCLVFGPGEFRVIDVDGDDLRRATTIAAVAQFAPERPPQGLFAVRIFVNRLVSSGAATALTDTSGNAMGTRQAATDTKVTVRAELLSMGAHSVVAVVESTAHVSPVVDHAGGDRFADVTRLTGELIDSLAKTAGLPRRANPVDLGLKTAPVLMPALTFVQPGSSSLQAELARLDALDREARLLTLVKQTDATAPRSRQRLIQSAPGGLVVAEARGISAQAGLAADDLILSVNDEPVFGQFTLARHLRNGPAKLIVKRGGAEREVTISVSSKK